VSAAPARGPFSAAEVAAAVGGRVLGDGGVALRSVAPLAEACPADLSFLARPEYLAAARASRAGCILVAADDVLPGRTRIVAPDVVRAQAIAMRMFFDPASRAEPGVHPQAVVDATSSLAPGVHVGAGAVVGARARLGRGSAVLARAVVGEGCVVGEDTVLHPGVVLYPGTELGARVVVHANAVLGSDGFGYASGPEGHLKIPQVGRVVVEDDVEIGAGACVDRAALGETRIGAGTKIDNLVQVGHNVVLGPHCIVVAQAGIAGSTRLGRFVALAGQSGVGGHLELGDGVRVAAKSAVLESVAAGETVAGIPAGPHAQWKRVAAALKRLPDLLRRVRRLEASMGTGGQERGDGDEHH
jgi:UDP-3-O-[3-hydroxymyristoyl] glucosamine N-acyltransferase